MRRRGLLFLALLLAGCRPEPPSPTPSAPAPTLRLLLGVDVASLDPQVPFDDVSSLVLDNVFESLVRLDSSFRLSSGLARRWINPDDRTWRFFLDTEARFSDGTPLRASDVRFSIERLRTLQGSKMQGLAHIIAGVEVVDDATVDIHTESPIAILNSLVFIPIMSERAVRAAGERIAERPLGTGPYKVTHWDKGRSVVLEANEHRRPLPAVRRAEFLFRPGGDMVEAVLRERADMTLFLPWARAQEIEAKKPAGLRVLGVPGINVFYLTFNVRPRIPGSPRPNPLRDPRVRRALSLAIDSEALVRGALGGFGKPANQLVVPQVFGYDPAAPRLRQDAAEARRLLAEAGQQSLEVSVVGFEGGARRTDALLLEQWRAIGVRGRLDALPYAELDRRLEAGEFDAAIQGYGCTTADASEILSFVLHTRDTAMGYGAGNTAGYGNAEVDRIARDNLRVFDPRTRLALLQQALRLATEDRVYLPLFSADRVFVLADRVRWTPPASGQVLLSDLSVAAPE